MALFDLVGVTGAVINNSCWDVSGILSTSKVVMWSVFSCLMLSRRFAPSNPGEDMICCEVLTKTELKRKLHENKKKLKKKKKDKQWNLRMRTSDHWLKVSLIYVEKKNVGRWMECCFKPRCSRIKSPMICVLQRWNIGVVGVANNGSLKKKCHCCDLGLMSPCWFIHTCTSRGVEV